MEERLHSTSITSWSRTRAAPPKRAAWHPHPQQPAARVRQHDCPLELLLSFLKNPKFDIRPIIEIIQEVFIPQKAEEEWGYHIPYMITGILNEHPRSGMKAMAAKKLPNLKKYYEDLRDGTSLD